MPYFLLAAIAHATVLIEAAAVNAVLWLDNIVAHCPDDVNRVWLVVAITWASLILNIFIVEWLIALMNHEEILIILVIIDEGGLLSQIS